MTPFIFFDLLFIPLSDFVLCIKINLFANLLVISFVFHRRLEVRTPSQVIGVSLAERGPEDSAQIQFNAHLCNAVVVRAYRRMVVVPMRDVSSCGPRNFVPLFLRGDRSPPA